MMWQPKDLNYMLVETDWGCVGVSYSAAGLWALALPAQDKGEVLAGLEAKGSLSREEDYPGLRKRLEEYFSGQRVHFADFSIDWRGYTDFRKQVLQITATIPYGVVQSYKWLATAAGRPAASRAVGGAMGSNRLPLIVPCHRVIRSDGNLGGFSSGLAMKVKLLQLEGITW
jgi:methylated-DNA-[protein]-cysteine S-methyltransferase